jgi:hypothetical protein
MRPATGLAVGRDVFRAAVATCRLCGWHRSLLTEAEAVAAAQVHGLLHLHITLPIRPQPIAERPRVIA